MPMQDSGLHAQRRTFEESGAGTPCFINVYHVTNTQSESTNQAIVRFNDVARMAGFGVFHGEEEESEAGTTSGAVEIGSNEWSFGYCENGTGVYSCRAKTNPMYTYRETIDVGCTYKSSAQIKQIISIMKEDWPGSSYELLARNCCHFVEVLCAELGVKAPPGWLNRLASSADMTLYVTNEAVTMAKQVGSNISRTALTTSSWLQQSFMGLIQPSAAATTSTPGSSHDNTPLAPLGTAACRGDSSSGGSSAGEAGIRRGGWFGSTREGPSTKETSQPPPAAHGSADSNAHRNNGKTHSSTGNLHRYVNGNNGNSSTQAGMLHGQLRRSDSWNEDSNRPLDPGYVDRSTWHGKVPALVRSGSMMINHSDPSQTYLLNSPLQSSHEEVRDGRESGDGRNGNPTPLDMIDFAAEPRTSWTPPSLSSAEASAGTRTPRESFGSGSRSGTDPSNNMNNNNSNNNYNSSNINNNSSNVISTHNTINSSSGARSGAEPWSATFSPMMRGATVVSAHAQQMTAATPDLLDFNSPVHEMPADLLPAGLSTTKWP